MLQVACLLALGFAAMWLGTVVLWRWNAAARESHITTVEQDCYRAVSDKLHYEKQVTGLRGERDAAVEGHLAADRLAASNKANAEAQRSENRQLHADLNAALDVNAALLERLRVNLNAKRPAPWKATVAALLQEYGRG